MQIIRLLEIRIETIDKKVRIEILMIIPEKYSDRVDECKYYYY